MVKDHESQLAQLKDASEKELLKVQQENYVLSVVRRTCSFYFSSFLLLYFNSGIYKNQIVSGVTY